MNAAGAPGRAGGAMDRPEWLDELINGMNNRRKPVSCPTFDGTTDVRKFLQMFAEVARANQWDEEDRTLHLKLALKGTAAECAQGETAEEVAEYLVNRFQLTREEARRELRNLKLRAGQDIHLFGNMVMKLVRMAEPDLEHEQLDERACAELIDAIGDRLLTREFRLQGPINFADALRRIQQYNSDMRVSKLHRLGVEQECENQSVEMENRVRKLEDDVKGLTEGVDKLQKGIKESVQANETKLGEILAKMDLGTQRSRPVCYNCNTPGHVARECRRPRSLNPQAGAFQLVCSICNARGHAAQNCNRGQLPANQNTRVCFTCGVGGHIARNCPNVRPAGQSALNSRGPQ